MSSFRPGQIPSGIEVKRPSWPSFTPGHQEAGVARQAAQSRGQVAPAAQQSYAAPADLESARMQASRLLQEAATEAEQAQAAARQQGFEQGRAEGIAAGQAELEALRNQAQLELQNARLQAENIRQAAESSAKLSQVEAEKQAQTIIVEAKEQANRIREEATVELQRRLDDSQAALVDLAVAAAVRLVQGHLALQPQSIINMVAVGLRRLKDTNCTVRLHPEDLPLLEVQRSTLERELGAGQLLLAPDTSLSQGSYLIHSPQGQIDGTLQHQAERIQSALEAALGSGGGKQA